MQEFKVDYIVVGQGLAGTWLSHELLRRSHKILVINHHTNNSSSRKAAGLYNPITGRNMVKTWLADQLFSNLETDYALLEKELGESFLHPIPIYRPFKSVEDCNDWSGRQADGQYSDFIQQVTSKAYGIDNISDSNGGIILKNCGYVDLPKMLNAYQRYLKDKGIYHEELFDHKEMNLAEDQVTYKNWTAKKIIFCEGPTQGNSYWNHLPFRLVRGETMDIVCDLKTDLIINQGVFIIPKNDFFTVGSTYDHNLLSYEPQESGIQNLTSRLKKIYQGSFQIVEKRAGIRPATHDRKPYIGFHKNFGTIGIFNGFGTKGVSLSPYFAKHFVSVLENKIDLDKEIDVQRVD